MEQTNWQVLPVAGGILDQPYELWERLMICKDEIAKWREELQSKQAQTEAAN